MSDQPEDEEGFDEATLQMAALLEAWFPNATGQKAVPTGRLTCWN